MRKRQSLVRRGWVGSILLLLCLGGVGSLLGAWKYSSFQQAFAASQNQPEPMETITTALARGQEHRQTATSVGTVLALRSITLRNESSGTVRQSNLTPGEIVEAGQLLVALDVSVEQSELKALEAQAALAETLLAIAQRAFENGALSDSEIVSARAERDVALAEIDRIKAIIDRKRIYAPFRARVGLSDLHIGQYLAEGTQLTTLQGVDEAVHVDFTVAQHVALGLREGDSVGVVHASSPAPVLARVVAVDSRIDEITRNALVRAKLEAGPNEGPLMPGASVRVRVPAGPPEAAVSIPVSALRKGAGGDHVFVIQPDATGQSRAHMRPVRSGAMLGDEILVHAGLAVGEEVAARGSFKLRDGMLVVIANGATTQAGPGH